MSDFIQCEERFARKVFSHYAYGDPMPVYARYYGEDDPVVGEYAITVYVRCEREAGHPGKHLATQAGPWLTESPQATEADEEVSDV